MIKMVPSSAALLLVKRLSKEDYSQVYVVLKKKNVPKKSFSLLQLHTDLSDIAALNYD